MNFIIFSRLWTTNESDFFEVFADSVCTILAYIKVVIKWRPFRNYCKLQMGSNVVKYVWASYLKGAEKTTSFPGKRTVVFFLNLLKQSDFREWVVNDRRSRWPQFPAAEPLLTRLIQCKAACGMDSSIW